MLFLTITLSLFLSLLKLPNKFHIFFLALLPFLIYILLTRLIKLLQADSNLLLERKYSKKTEDIILSLRSKKHDFSNHLHVINHLFKSKRYEDLHIYLNELCADLDVSQTLIHLNNSSIAGLLQSKYEVAKNRNLSFHIEVKHLMPKTGMQNYELIQVVGNLLDNAFDAEFEATKNQDSIVPQVSVRISQLLNSFLVISVHNEHSVIPKHKHTLIFKEGYSTKYKHTGLGLAAIKKVIDKAQGRLEVNSSEKNGTTFSIFIPIITDKIIEKEGGQVG
ncbi:sensor histidine kinase [Bacillus inaquosorum]|uniref:sensor histidine kinase n=2 Tax=Bacillus TaxID=1386 RepID=UPI001CDC0181|nr:ATP-binding protein [Bacillus inaquosorum]MEC0518477.1 ATP-binding protein [Bacillus inaquosorum]MEC0608620.1 ATP-binding protein [Bacillus inaquosorum]